MSLQTKLNWLIDRKIQLITTIKNLTTEHNVQATSVFTPTNISGKKYSDITWDDILKNSNAFFDYGFAEVVYTGMYDLNGSLDYSQYVNYSGRGVNVSVTKVSTGTFNLSLTKLSDLDVYNTQYVVYGMGGHRESNYDQSTYVTIVRTNSTFANPGTYKILTGDQEDLYDGVFTIFIFAFTTS